MHFSFKSDREPAIRSLLAEAAALAGVKAEKEATDTDDDNDEDTEHKDQPPTQPATTPAAVPETSSPGESQSNAAAERSVQMLEDMARTLKLALEDRIDAKIPCNHPIMAWIPDHAAMLLTKCHVGPDGKSGYERLHGKPPRDRLAEFGEVVFYYVPKKLRGKMAARWRVGIFIGNIKEPLLSNMHLCVCQSSRRAR